MCVDCGDGLCGRCSSRRPLRDKSPQLLCETVQLWVLLHNSETVGSLVLRTQDDSADLPLLDCTGAAGYAGATADVQ